MTEILHQRAMLENTTLNRGCGGRSHTVLSNMPAPVQDVPPEGLQIAAYAAKTFLQHKH